jgi:3-methyladenine DNA glycosylase Tag
MKSKTALRLSDDHEGKSTKVVRLDGQIQALFNKMILYAWASCPEMSNLTSFYSELSPRKITNKSILTELGWIIYSSGFRFDVVKKYWPAIKEAFYQFDVEKVASLSKDQEAQAKEICDRSGFRNLRKARWCIQNAQRIVELDHEKRRFGGLKGYFVELSKKPPLELVRLAPNLVFELRFKGIGETTIFHLMKNVGIDIFKPDIHVRRILANMRLINDERSSTSEICRVMSLLSSTFKMRISELDTVLFVYGRIASDRIETVLPATD